MRVYKASFLMLVLFIVISILLGCSPQPAPGEPSDSQPTSVATDPDAPTPTVIAPPEVSPCVSPCGVISL